MACIKTDPQHHQNRADVAATLGVSIPPVVNEFCNDCGAYHMMETGEQGDSRYGLPPVDVAKKEKPDTWQPRAFCHTCHAYHNADNRCGGPRDATEWKDKVIG